MAYCSQLYVHLNLLDKNRTAASGVGFFAYQVHEKNALTFSASMMLGAAVKSSEYQAVAEGQVYVKMFEIGYSKLVRYSRRSRGACQQGNFSCVFDLDAEDIYLSLCRVLSTLLAKESECFLLGAITQRPNDGDMIKLFLCRLVQSSTDPIVASVLYSST